jgi:glucokinase
MASRPGALAGYGSRRNVTASQVIGVDVGATKILGGLVGPDGSLGRRVRIPSTVGSQEELLAALDSVVSELLVDDVAAIGFGIPSRIDQRSGRVVGTVNLPLANVDFRGRMAEKFGLPVGIDNDAHVAAIGEWRAGAGRGVQNMVMLTLGTGVGGGIILNGRPFRGATGSGCEFGHMVVQHNGPPCYGNCTGRGHLEALASGHVAGQLARESFGPHADSRELVRLGEEGNERALEILRGIGEALGSALGSIVNIFNPELIVIGGGFAAAGELILTPARERMLVEGLTPGKDMVRVVRAELGSDAGLVGSGFVAYEAYEQNGV